MRRLTTLWRRVFVIVLALAMLGSAASSAVVAEDDPPANPVVPPEPIPPAYTSLKDLHIHTDLVQSHQANATIIIPSSGLYAAAAGRIQRAIAERTTVTLPVANDEIRQATVPVAGNLILIGNRSTHRIIEELYNHYYTLLDLRYPGPGGSVVRTLHNPYGDGHNVIFIGGSDADGVDAASQVFVQEIHRAELRPGGLTIGRLARIRLGDEIVVPRDVRQFKVWDASRGYGSVGYFGWNSISKHMAMYYMTGNTFNAREVIRLAFPDEEARRQIAEIDGERIENKDEPLSGPYHYNAHLMILFWDLIEESPVFTDEERLRMTNAFSRQLLHRKGEGIYNLISPAPSVGSRHGQWAAVSIYCLGRYFQKDYPNPIWRHCIRSAEMHFASLHRYTWVGGAFHAMHWYNTGIAPIFTYLALSGDRKPVENGTLRKLGRGLEILASGENRDPNLAFTSVGFLHKAAYLFQDGRYIYYRQRCGVDTNGFRLGQSFWPEDHLAPTPPDDLVGQWSVFELSEPSWRARQNGFRLEESFLYASYRSGVDASGDFILLNGLNDQARNPYHTFAVLRLRIAGVMLLTGFRNQVLTRVDGMVEPRIAMNGALRYRDVIGETAVVTGEVPDAAYCNWRRTLVQRTGQYALVVDELKVRGDSDNVEVQVEWQSGQEQTVAAPGILRLAESDGEIFDVCLSDPVRTSICGGVATMSWVNTRNSGRSRIFFSLLAPNPDAITSSPSCVRVADNAAALSLPAPAIAVAGAYDGVEAELAVLATDHLFAKGLKRVDGLISATAPVDLEWDFVTGGMHLVAEKATQINLELAGDLQVDGGRAPFEPGEASGSVLSIAPGRHVLEKIKPRSVFIKKVAGRLHIMLAKGQAVRLERARGVGTETLVKAPLLRAEFETDVGGRVVDLITMPTDRGRMICVAEANRVHVLSAEGDPMKTFDADGMIRMMRWWPEHELLLVGCADEQVIAFDSTGERQWVFTSEMDPAVFSAAKTYWFKSHPGHEGIHGLATGLFLNGRSQAFVGSACTLEIIDENGDLVKRMPQFWGKVSLFTVVDGPRGALNLLAARKYNGSNTVGIINNKTLDPNVRGFDSVPAGYTYVGGWSSMNRHHLFYDDFDGDGVKEVAGEINGSWNRVTIWTVEGEALYDANFGPGPRIPDKHMRDLDIGDIDGDGKKEIVVATADQLVVALDSQCQKRWIKRLHRRPTVIKIARPWRPAAASGAWIVVGCENGDVVVLDGQGSVIRAAQVEGEPVCIAGFDEPQVGQGVLLATASGQVKLFKVGE